MAAKFTDEPQHILRFSDFTLQPSRMLPPILGYEKEPLVSLEEATDPLISIVPEVERMVWTVKQRNFDGEHGLTDDEAAAITLYTMEWEPTDNSLYVILNKTLQAANRKLLKPWFLYLRLIMTSLAKLPSDSNRLTVYRGVKLDLSAQYPKGNTVTWWGFSSCTTSIGVLSNEQYLGRSGTRTLFTIDCSSAKSLKDYSLFPKEEEILLPPARQFQVIDSLNSGNELHIIQLKEIQPKFPLINPVPQPTLHPPIPLMPNPTPLADPPISSMSKSTSFSHPPILSVPKATSLPDPPLSSIPKPTPRPGPPIPPRLKPAPLPDPSIPSIPQATSHSDPLKSFKPPKCNDPNLQKYFDAMYFDQTVTTLELGGNEIGNQGAQHLANALEGNKTLTTIYLGGNKIGDQGVQHLGHSLEINKTLTTLYLRGNKIGAKGAQHLANALESNKTLTILYLGGNKIGDQGAEYLGNALRMNKVTTILVLLPLLHFTSSFTQTVTTLELGGNEIGNQGAQHLANALRINKTLTTLHLCWNKVGDKGAQHLGNALEINKVTTILVLLPLLHFT
ncbi:unnamed protein product [Adineta steineri]|uniref:NAD(P)(+)--arginine ADP-ribosyltransferase n=1 Tax=Adineta steineri TaxID=433720 RepID=A0A819IWB4_9BILA|nr:unnamed protein product [Adineta steineri]